ncbi:MAG TPA: hypothetical protein DCL38_11095 [Lachnospiraceae bacterium]|nr:hypothetical protein [Lachnospiraceae bacterium]
MPATAASPETAPFAAAALPETVPFAAAVLPETGALLPAVLQPAASRSPDGSCPAVHPIRPDFPRRVVPPWGPETVSPYSVKNYHMQLSSDYED